MHRFCARGTELTNRQTDVCRYRRAAGTQRQFNLPALRRERFVKLHLYFSYQSITDLSIRKLMCYTIKYSKEIQQHLQNITKSSGPLVYLFREFRENPPPRNIVSSSANDRQTDRQTRMVVRTVPRHQCSGCSDIAYLCAGMTPFSFLQAVVGSGSPDAVQRNTTSECSWTTASTGPRTIVGFSATDRGILTVQPPSECFF